MPRMSDTMEEGNILVWHKKVGDDIKVGDVLAEVETDKATMDLESFYDGNLLFIGVEKGTIAVNAILAVIGKKERTTKPHWKVQEANLKVHLLLAAQILLPFPPLPYLK